MLKLIIDSGNTLVKYALFQDLKLLEIIKRPQDAQLEIPFKTKLDAAIFSTVSHPSKNFENLLQNIPFLELNPQTHLPFTSQYTSPKTLGNDRRALVMGGKQRFPNQNVLIFSLGTCITTDFIDKNGVYWGGSISPGLEMRFKALNNFTKNLPLVKYKEDIELIGKNTESSIQSGVFQGMLFEMQGRIDAYQKKMGEIKVILTGGNYYFFEKKFKNEIFAEPNLILDGLNHILDYNLEKF